MMLLNMLLVAAMLTPATASKPMPSSLNEVPKVWQRLAYCESRYDLRAVSPSGEHFGLWQLHRGFYKHLGYNPKRATFREQWVTALYVYERQGARAWACAREAGLK